MGRFTKYILLAVFISLQPKVAFSSEELLPIVSSPHKMTTHDLKGGFTELLPYILPAPYQGNAGTCLFMAHTGVAEWWLARLNPQIPQKLDGKFDLSERYSINLSVLDIGDHEVNNWRTDTIFRFNTNGESFANRLYRFSKGWYKRNSRGDRVKAGKADPHARYGIGYNWIPELDSLETGSIQLPHFTREILFADPAKNQWSINVAPADIVQQVKTALKTRKAPIVVIYNHMGYWHTVILLGFNDKASTHKCTYVNDYITYMPQRAAELKSQAGKTQDEKLKRKLLAKARSALKRGAQAAKAFKQSGGCKEQGVFYVRDSIYPDKTLPLYDYDLTRTGEEEHYSTKIITREYQWLEIFANHIYQILIL